MSTVRANTFQSNSGGRPAITGGALCLAWAAFDGTAGSPTFQSQFNCSSVTKNGTGDWTINFTAALADANYVVTGIMDVATGAALNTHAPMNLHTRSTTSVRVLGSNNAGTATDMAYVSVAIFGN